MAAAGSLAPDANVNDFPERWKVPDNRHSRRAPVTLMESYRGNTNFLPRPLARDMMTRVSQNRHGLGSRINGSGRTLVFHHDSAKNSYRARIEGRLETG